MKELLLELKACKPAIEWAADKTWPEIFETCHRGDWLLWLFRKTTDNKRLLTLAKGHCANTVRHLMKDERSIKAVDAAIAYGNNEIGDKDLAAAADAAADAYAYAAAASAAAAAEYAYADAYAAAASAAAAAAYAAAARIKSQLETANICRKYLPIEVWNIDNDGKLINQ